MTRATRHWFYAANLVVTVTGGIYGWTKYACAPSDPFALVNHPLQPHALHVHVVSAPLLVLMIGMIWQTHALAKLRGNQTPSRRSGWLLLAAAFPMMASGALIQTAVAPWWRTFWIGVHLLSSICWLIGSLAHAWRGWRR